MLRSRRSMLRTLRDRKRSDPLRRNLKLVGECNALLASRSDPTCHVGCVKETKAFRPRERNALTPRPISFVFVIGSVDLPIYARTV